jgi:hypothetical protein
VTEARKRSTSDGNALFDNYSAAATKLVAFIRARSINATNAERPARHDRRARRCGRTFDFPSTLWSPGVKFPKSRTTVDSAPLVRES